MKFNVYKHKDGSIRSVVSPSLDENVCLESQNWTFLGTEERNIIPPMKEVVKEANIYHDGESDRVVYVRGGIPKDSYDRKLTYKIKEPV